MPELYAVGGSVRDYLLGRAAKDRDFVLVGGTEADVYECWPDAKRVGQAFPVFLVSSPEIAGEVALARRERKTAAGHGGFAVDFGPEVTLAEDLGRRDLTINAIAMHSGSGCRDPYNGRQDIEDRILRHVSAAFADDPLRVYRLARFAAELEGFSVAPETYELCRSISQDELRALSIERVRIEFMKALVGPQPHRFFEVLQQIGHLRVHFPELAALAEVSAGPVEHHGEGDALTHTLMVLREAAKLSASSYVRFAALLHDLGKALTPKELLPKHHGHEDSGVTLVDVFCERFHFGSDYVKAATLACREHLNVHRFAERRRVSMVDTVVMADRTALKAEGLADVATADALGRIPAKNSEGPELLRVIAPVVRACAIGAIPTHLSGPAIGEHVRIVRAAAVKRFLFGRSGGADE